MAAALHEGELPEPTATAPLPPLLSSSVRMAQPVLLTFEDITYSTRIHGADRTVLRGITGFVRGGSLLAVLGPSGSGKTTLLDVLALRRREGLRGGTVLVDGQSIDGTRYRRQRGYVEQEDLFHSFLTVEETIRFTATLRTPPCVDEVSLRARVQRAIQLLGIEHVRHCRVGSTLVRGISDGEKKRCAVAVELVTAPSLLLLDEPTTGLDTFTALHLVSLLKSLAQSGMAIIFSIHQPRASIYQLFDHVLLLTGAGEQAFFGPAAEAVPFLASLGICSPYPQNPADYLLDAVSAVGGVEGDCPALSDPITHRFAPPVTQARDIVAAFSARRRPQIAQEIRHAVSLARSHRGARVDEDESEADTHAPLLLSPSTEAPVAAYFRGTWTQVRVVATRCVLNTMRGPVATVVSVSVALVFALLIGSIYYHVGVDQASIRRRMGVLFFVMMNTTFSALGNLDSYLSGRALYSREHSNGMYSPAAYYVGKMMKDVPFGILVNTAFNGVVYVLVGLQPSWYRFAVFDAVCVLVMLNSYAMCLLKSNLAKNHSTANISASLVLVLYLLPTGGMLVSLDKIPLVWRWIKYVSFVRYAFAALVANEFASLEFVCPVVADGEQSASAAAYPCVRSGDEYAASLGFVEGDVPLYVMILAGSVIAYLFMGYLVLRLWRSRVL